MRNDRIGKKEPWMVMEIEPDVAAIMETLLSWAVEMAPERYTGPMRPEAEIRETPDGVVIHAHLPGVDRDDIHVSVRENVLTVRALTRGGYAALHDPMQGVNARVGAFYRVFTLPDYVYRQGVRAEFEAGTLTVFIQKPRFHPFRT